MKYNELSLNKQTPATRPGRGIAAGKGKTAGRGTKGQNSRTGGGVRPGFEGGQNPLVQRIPKLPGFRSIHAKAENVYTSQLDSLAARVDNNVLFEAGLISSPYVRVKLLFDTAVTKKHTIKLQGASKAAAEAVKKAGGDFDIVARPKRAAKEKTTK